MAPGIAAATCPAVTGPSGLARVEASPCTYAATEPAVCGSAPAARIEPARPARTSPEPAVASHGVPERLTRVGRPPVAIRVRRPLRRTVVLQRLAAFSTCPSG